MFVFISKLFGFFLRMKLLLIIAVLASYGLFTIGRYVSSPNIPKTPTVLIISEKEKRLYDYTYFAMQIIKAQLSPARAMAVSKVIVSTAMQRFASENQARDWIVLIAIESRFNGAATSPVGALGLGQLLPQYVVDFSKTCPGGSFVQSDLLDDATNAYLSACYFKYLLDKNESNLPYALVSYNAGPSSVSLRNFQTLTNMPDEPANYVSRHTLVTTLLEAKIAALASYNPPTKTALKLVENR